jgi:hypothetical protein
MTRTYKRWMAAVAAGCSLVAGVATAEQAVPAPGGLRHAVVCPPFKGPADLAAVYHAEMLAMLQASDGD